MSLRSKHLFLISLIIIILSSTVFGLSWPVWPDSSLQHIRGIYGSYWGENQFHSGTDIAVPPGTPTYAMESGYIKAIITLNNDNSYWRTVICDSAGTGITEGWMYAHIIPVTGLYVGDYVEAGTFLGNTAAWPLRPEVDPHLHLSRVKYWGDSANWANHFFDGWEFIANPLDYLDDVVKINDTTPPVFEPAHLGGLFGLLKQPVSPYMYFNPDDTISGDIDVIARGYDYHGYYLFKGVIYKLEYKLSGPTPVDWIISFELKDPFGSYATMPSIFYTVYHNDVFCSSYISVLDSQVYYFNLTNTDGDNIMENEDLSYCLQTAGLNNGEYYILARASDYIGNETVDSMPVIIANYFDLSGTVTLAGHSPTIENSHISLSPDGHTDSTDELGLFFIPDAGGGPQLVSISRAGYETFDTSLIMNTDHELTVQLNLADFICGDVDDTGSHNIFDITWLIAFLYLDGPSPIPYDSGDPNGDNSINIFDVTFLISYLYLDGPEPVSCFDN